MRRQTLLGLLVAALAAGGWAGWTATARPRVVVAPPAVDFGPITGRRTLAVEVRNDGRAPLRVLAVTTSCGCTTATVGAMLIGPRDATSLSITFDPVAHGPQPGPARHAVYVRTNDPGAPETEVEVRAVVVKGVAR